MRLSHIGTPHFGHFGKLRANRAASKTVDAGMDTSMRNFKNFNPCRFFVYPLPAQVE
jgi:hypothetical protein